MTISPYVRVIRFEISWVDTLWGGILPSGRCRGGWGPMRLTIDNLWDISREAQPNSTSIGEDIGSHLNFPFTSMRRTTLVTWLRWTSLSLRRAKPKLLVNRHHDPLGSRNTLRKKSRAHAPPIRIVANPRPSAPSVLGHQPIVASSLVKP
jgi:hypothetical protein